MKMDIYKIAELTKETSPYLFSTDTMRFFRQTMRKWKIKEVGGRWKISQDSRDTDGRLMGTTVRFFNPQNNELERE